jgi:hypothetical protein
MFLILVRKAASISNRETVGNWLDDFWQARQDNATGQNSYALAV